MTLLRHLVDAVLGTLIGATLGVCGWLATMYLILR